MFIIRHLKSEVSLITRNIIKTNATRRWYNDLQSENVPAVTPTAIKRTLKSFNLGFEDGYTCLVTSCPSCCRNVKSHTSKVFINKTTGMYMCMYCKKTGPWNQFEILLTKKKSKKTQSENETDESENNYFIEQENLTKYLENIKQSTGELNTLKTDTFISILKQFNLPNIMHGSIKNLDIRINEDNKVLYFPLENYESQIVGYRTMSIDPKGEKTLPSISYGGLLTAKLPKSKDTAILVPNISDFLVLINSANVTGNIVCLPNGANNLSQYVLPSLERFKKLILWLGDDINSWDSSRQFAKKLGEKRCYLIRPSDTYQLPHLQENQDFKAIINAAQPMFHKSITTFASLRADVLSDLQNIDKVQGVKWKRYPTLNKILKGHRRGELTVITGPTGSGKTTFISEYSLDLAMQGVNTLWGSFEIRNARLARTMLQQMSGVPLDENLHLFDKWADDFEKLPIYFMTFHGQQSIKIVMEAVEHATYVHDIAHVIIDNVQFMMGMADDTKHIDRFWKQDVIIAAFRTFATRTNCHVTLVIHPRKEREDEDLTTSSIFGGAKASQEADNVLIIQDKRLTSLKGKKYLQVAKNRYSGDLGIMALDFNKSSLSYAQKKPKKTSEENIAVGNIT